MHPTKLSCLIFFPGTHWCSFFSWIHYWTLDRCIFLSSSSLSRRLWTILHSTGASGSHVGFTGSSIFICIFQRNSPERKKSMYLSFFDDIMMRKVLTSVASMPARMHNHRFHCSCCGNHLLNSDQS